MTNSKNLAKASALRLHPKVFMIQINLDISRKDVKNCGENWIARESQPTGEKVVKHNYLSIIGSRSLLIQWSPPGA
jgi:hypothetical protein